MRLLPPPKLGQSAKDALRQLPGSVAATGRYAVLVLGFSTIQHIYPWSSQQGCRLG